MAPVVPMRASMPSDRWLNFNTSSISHPERLIRAINFYLPHDITIKEAVDAENLSMPSIAPCPRSINIPSLMTG